MGSRARKKWQGDLLSTLPTRESSEEDEEEDSDEEDAKEAPATVNKTKGGFALMIDDDDDDDEEEENSSSKEESYNDSNDNGDTVKEEVPVPTSNVNVATHTTDADENVEQIEDDLDAILDEFQQQDLQSTDSKPKSSNKMTRSSEFAPILRNVDVRDLDIDRSLRNALHGATESAAASRGVRGGRTTQLFGAPPPNTVRPPHYVGGGLGMTSYDRLDEARIPWPYCQKSTPPTNDSSSESSSFPFTNADPSRWYTFQHSDTYARELADYRQIEQSGDVNALLLFVAHHPFCTDALLQLVSVLNQTNHANEGQQLLKRCLWVYECAALQSFHKDLLYASQHALMDKNRPENTKFFEALWELIRQAITTSLHKSAWAIGRYLWGLDPWRDPMGVLLVIDAFALSCQTDEADQWIIEMVQNSHISQIWYKESNSDDDAAVAPYHCGKLDDMPNWAFSYALALFRVRGSDDETSNAALRRALRSYPAVVGRLLQKLDVDTTGRSFRRDWVTVLDKATQRSKDLHHAYLAQDDTITTTATLQAVDLIIKVFLERQKSSWGDDDVLQWLYDNLCAVLDEPLEAPPLCSALMRYTRFKPPHYETRVQQLPADANIVDPGLVAHALVVDANRGRLLRRQQQRQQEDAAQMFAAAQQQQHIVGGPPTGIVDPDWPIAEVFWRSMLPWNHVDGVPPPRR